MQARVVKKEARKGKHLETVLEKERKCEVKKSGDQQKVQILKATTQLLSVMVPFLLILKISIKKMCMWKVNWRCCLYATMRKGESKVLGNWSCRCRSVSMDLVPGLRADGASSGSLPSLVIEWSEYCGSTQYTHHCYGPHDLELLDLCNPGILISKNNTLHDGHWSGLLTREIRPHCQGVLSNFTVHNKKNL